MNKEFKMNRKLNLKRLPGGRGLFHKGLLIGILIFLTACQGALPNTGAQTTGGANQPVQAATSAAVSTSEPTSTTSSTAAQAGSTPQPVACTSPATLTPAVTEGPFYKAGSPERASLLGSGISGIQITITGYVLTTDCKPVAGALLDFWQANSQGQYDNSGYTLRGHQYTDASGRYTLVTVIPGLYPGRTEHIHVKVQAPGGPVLTTQLFFPGVSSNQSDGIYSPALLLTNFQDASGGKSATFNFVVSAK